MPAGPGKYDRYCTEVRVRTGAEAVVLIILNGDRGSGFSVQAQGQELPPAALADLLQRVIDQLVTNDAARNVDSSPPHSSP